MIPVSKSPNTKLLKLKQFGIGMIDYAVCLDNTSSLTIMLTTPYNVYPFTPHFYIVKLGFTGVYLVFLFLL